jgi:hypothetical protein
MSRGEHARAHPHDLETIADVGSRPPRAVFGICVACGVWLPRRSARHVSLRARDARGPELVDACVAGDVGALPAPHPDVVERVMLSLAFRLGARVPFASGTARASRKERGPGAGRPSALRAPRRAPPPPTRPTHTTTEEVLTIIAGPSGTSRAARRVAGVQRRDPPFSAHTYRPFATRATRSPDLPRRRGGAGGDEVRVAALGAAHAVACR